MKNIIFRILSVILLTSIIFSALSFFVYADGIENQSNQQQQIKQELHSEHILSFSCHYDPKAETVNLKGTIDYDAFALYSGATLLIYVIPSGKSENDVINDNNSSPIAESPISISFAFSFKVSSIEQRYYRYAVFIRSAEGEYILTTEAQYAETDANFAIPESKNNFKGVSGNYSSNISAVNAQITTIPVYLDMIYASDSRGYIYQADELQIFFNKNYVDELDSQIRSLSLFDTTVYLQFLLRSGGIMPTYMSEGAEYALPDTFEKDTILYLHAVTDFLVSRYSDSIDGQIGGIILGKSWDEPGRYNSFENISYERYVLMCGNYAAIVSNAARDIDPSINIVLSFNGNGFFTEQKENSTTNDRFSVKVLLSSLMEYFDASSYSGLKCLLMIETDETPLEITAKDLKDGINIYKELADNKFYIGKQEHISNFLNELSAKYKSATKYYSIRWTPKKQLRGNVLCAAYAYAFYNLWADSNVLSYIVEFSAKAENRENFSDLLYVIKNIDTENSFEATKNLLLLFGERTWSDVIEKVLPNLGEKKYYSAEALNQLPKNLKGEFSYFDFSKAFSTDGWRSGAGSSDLKIDYLLTGEKVLKSNLFVGNDDFCDLIYKYEYAENISYTPYIKFDFEIISEQISPLYEIKFTFKGEDATFDSNSIIKGNQQNEIILNMSGAKDISLLEAVKISVRSLDDTVENCTLCIRNIKGYSKKYNDKELNAFVEKERDKQKHSDDIDSGYNVWVRIVFVAGIIFISAIFGFVLIFILQRNSRNRRRE